LTEDAIRPQRIAVVAYREGRRLERAATGAEALEERDDGMDSLHSALTAELAPGEMSLAVTMDMTLVARYFVRVGDHAVNIARHVANLAGPNPNWQPIPGLARALSSPGRFTFE
jgi:phosphate uptake regulator